VHAVIATLGSEGHRGLTEHEAGKRLGQ